MQLHAAVAADLRDCCQLVEAVNGGCLCLLGDAGRRRLHTMDVATAIGGDVVEIGSVDPGAVAFEDDQLGAAGEKLGCVAFVLVDMAFAVADNCPIRRCQHSQGQRVGC